MIFLGITIPIGILLGLLLFFSGLYNRNRLAAAASGGLDMFTTNFENQLDSVENYLLNLSLNDASFRSLSEQTDRTRAYLDAYEIAQGFPAVLAANDALMGVVLRSGSGNLYVGRYGAAAQQLKQKLNLEAYLGQPGQTNKMMTKGWYLRTIGQRLYLLRSVFYQKASLTAAVDLRLVFEELVKDYGLDGRVIVMNDSGNVLAGDANLLPTKMEWNSAGYCMTKVGRDSRLVVRKQVKALTANNQLNSQTLRYFYQDFMQMLFSLPEKKRQDDMFREPEALELYRNGMKTVPDMKALVHYVASVWDSETEESSQSTVEIIMAYIAEHLENELRREELAEAVHLNPDYMARLFKKETGMNLKDYIIQQKMQEAQSLLCTTNLPISLIAAKVGYTNFGHFSTSYKKFYHKTPQEERSAAL